jgi:hypothetical protein
MIAVGRRRNGFVAVRIFGREHPVPAKPGVRADAGERRVAGVRQADHRELRGDPVQRRDRVRPRLSRCPEAASERTASAALMSASAATSVAASRSITVLLA